MGFLNILGEEEIHRILGKVNSHNTGRVWENTNTLKLRGFLNILVEVEIHTIPKPWNE